jgi:hypothetical protein
MSREFRRPAARCRSPTLYQREDQEPEALTSLYGSWIASAAKQVDHLPAGCVPVGLPCPRNDPEGMTVTDDEYTEPTAALTGGANSHRRPITDINARLDGLEGGVRPALRVLGEPLIGIGACPAWTCQLTDNE